MWKRRHSWQANGPENRGAEKRDRFDPYRFRHFIRDEGPTMNTNDRKKEDKKALQLGMPFGTASGKLRKALLFDLLVRLELNFCFRCTSEIDGVEELSIEHKVAWLDSDDPVGKFFDLANVSFSHLNCNIKAGRRPSRKYSTPEERRASHTAVTTRWKRENYSPADRKERYAREGR